MKKIWGILICIVVLLSFTGCENKKEEESTNSSSNPSQEEEKEYLTGLHHVEIVIKDYGTIALELDADVAPISVTNFIDLAKSGFYDGTTFHRIINGFMMQGGAAKNGEYVPTIKGEFASNGVENSIKHDRGVISMARANDKNSASSQFFIVQEDSPHLDGEYAAFGHVTSGMEVVDEICKNTPVVDNNGTVLTQNQPIIRIVKVID